MKHDKLTVFLLVFSVVYLLMMPFAALREDMGIYDGVIRLHVLADSDEPEAQRLKLKVRDGILGIMDDMLDGTETLRRGRGAGSGKKRSARSGEILRENGSNSRSTSR
ncbi:MAG: stage II sporulation protein R [Eubacteriales bacterium]